MPHAGWEKSCNGSRTLLLTLRRAVLDQITGHRTFLVEPFLCGGTDLFGGDGANAIRPVSDVLDTEAGGERAPIPARQDRLVVLGVDGPCDQLGLDALEILGVNRVLRDVGDHLVDRLLHLRKLDAGFRRRRDGELGRIERGALVAGAGADREWTVDPQRAIKIGVAAAAHQLRQYVEGRAFPGRRRGGGGNEIVAAYAGLFDAGIGQRHGARRNRHRFLWTNPLRGYRRLCRDIAECPLHHGADIPGIDVAGDHQDRIVRRIETPVERQRVLAVELLDFVVPADHRTPVGMVQIERRHDLLGEPRLRVVGDPHVVFLKHDVALRQHVFILQDQAGHAVRLELHYPRQLLARYALEIAGVVGGCEGVLVAADPQHGLGKLAGRMLAGALEHQMFKEVRKARLAGGLVGGADLVPDHLRDHRRAVVRDHHDLQSVAEAEAGGRLGGDRGLGANAVRRDGGRGEQRSEQGDGEAVCEHYDLSGAPVPQKLAPALRKDTRKCSNRSGRTEMFGNEAAASYTARLPLSV